MSVNNKTAERLNKLAIPYHIGVTVRSSYKPARRWYSVGTTREGRWHQVAGFTTATAVVAYLTQIIFSPRQENAK